MSPSRMSFYNLYYSVRRNDGGDGMSKRLVNPGRGSTKYKYYRRRLKQRSHMLREIFLGWRTVHMWINLGHSWKDQAIVDLRAECESVP
jgi:hypothetical protein